jgi:hypothetical protein
MYSSRSLSKFAFPASESPIIPVPDLHPDSLSLEGLLCETCHRLSGLLGGAFNACHLHHSTLRAAPRVLLIDAGEALREGSGLLGVARKKVYKLCLIDKAI